MVTVSTKKDANVVQVSFECEDEKNADEIFNIINECLLEGRFMGMVLEDPKIITEH